MSFRRSLAPLLVALTALAPGEAFAGGVEMVSQDVAMGRSDGSTRALSARAAPRAFDMVGLHWRGRGSVWFRTAAGPGGWSGWKPARPEHEDQADRGSAEAEAAAGWKLGNPYWTGPARWIQYRVSGRVTRLRAFFIRTPVSRRPAGASFARANAPRIIRRADWGADESIVRGSPYYADRVRFAVVHHTAGANQYTAAQSAAIIRGIQRYHVLANGWNDIGYNFLVDKYGQVFEGRAGGIAANVVGAHARGFNTGSTGVAVLGTYSSTGVSRSGRAALRRLLAWRLDVAHVDPLSTLRFESYGNEQFPAGTAVRLRAVSGHRDTGQTSCPGTTLYGALDAIARGVSRIGLPKLYEPRVGGSLGGPVRFTGRLSSSRPWTVSVTNGVGAVIAEGRGTGTSIDWTWDSASAPIDRYTWRMSSGTEVRPATGSVPTPPPLAVRGLRVSQAVVTPNGDAVSERTRISFALSVRATVRVEVLASGALVHTLVPDRVTPAGRASVAWGGRANGEPVPDGRYEIVVTAITAREEVVERIGLVVDRTLGALTATPGAFSPNGDGRQDQLALGFDLARPADVRVQVLRGRRPVATLAALAPRSAGHHVGLWNGRLAGRTARDGRYALRVEAFTSLGRRVLRRPVQLDTARPTLRLLAARFVRGVTRLRFFLSEEAQLTIWYGTRAWSDGSSIVVDRPAGKRSVRRRIPARIVRIVARDEAGNRSRAIVARLSS
jgi:N-acetylmuramoyl-L-alanine amidase